MKKRTKQPAPPPSPFPFVMETFNPPLWSLGQCRQDAPSCFNGTVRIRRYVVRVEEIPETDDVLRARLADLWERCDNHHHWDPLKAAAKTLGMELDNEALGKRKAPR